MTGIATGLRGQSTDEATTDPVTGPLGATNRQILR
jgi:hypothetical protein